MSRKLGRKHSQYIDAAKAAAEQHAHKDRLGRPVTGLYRVKLLGEHTFLRDVYWNPQVPNRQCDKGISKALTARKHKHYAKLQRYFERTSTGR